MARLDAIPIEDLWVLLDEIDESVPTQRVLVEIAAKKGDYNSCLIHRAVSP